MTQRSTRRCRRALITKVVCSLVHETVHERSWTCQRSMFVHVQFTTCAPAAAVHENRLFMNSVRSRSVHGTPARTVPRDALCPRPGSSHPSIHHTRYLPPNLPTTFLESRAAANSCGRQLYHSSPTDPHEPCRSAMEPTRMALPTSWTDGPAPALLPSRSRFIRAARSLAASAPRSWS